MMGCTIAILGMSVLFVLWSQTRSYQLKRMANMLHLHYNRELEYLLTQENTRQLALLAQLPRRFSHVLTCQEPGIFVRLSQVYFPNKPAVTLFSAELTSASFTPFCLFPRKEKEMGASLPDDLAARYTLKAPAGYVLPPEVLGFLRTARPCYLELTKTALVYHEFDSKPVCELQPLRWRGIQLVKALAKQPAKQPMSKQAAQLAEASFQATLQLKNLPGGDAAGMSVSPQGGGHSIYIFIFIVLLGGIGLLTWVMLHQVAGR